MLMAAVPCALPAAAGEKPKYGGTLTYMIPVLHSREQSLKAPQATRAQDQGQERLRLPRSSLRHTNLLRIHNFLYIDIEHMMVQQTTLATLLR